MDLFFVTGNSKKLSEARGILGNQLLSIKLDLPELQGISQYIAKEKAYLAAERTNKSIFVDDVSFEMSCLGGFPGPYVRNFLETLGTQKIYDISQKLGDSHCLMRCNIGYCEPGKAPILFTGVVSGKIVAPKNNNHVWLDEIFMPDGLTETFADMPLTEKNKISHRALALYSFKEYLDKCK